MTSIRPTTSDRPSPGHASTFNADDTLVYLDSRARRLAVQATAIAALLAYAGYLIYRLLYTINYDAIVFSTTDVSMVQKKKAGRPAAATNEKFKECCLKAFAWTYEADGKTRCRFRVPAQLEAFDQCARENRIGRTPVL